MRPGTAEFEEGLRREREWWVVATSGLRPDEWHQAYRIEKSAITGHFRALPPYHKPPIELEATSTEEAISETFQKLASLEISGFNARYDRHEQEEAKRREAFLEEFSKNEKVRRQQARTMRLEEDPLWCEALMPGEAAVRCCKDKGHKGAHVCYKPARHWS